MRTALAADDPDVDLGGMLVQGGHLTAGELRAIIHSVVLDAIIALTVPLTADATLDGVRMVAGKSHWAQSFCRLSVASVRAEAVQRAGRMAAYDLSEAARLELRDLSHGPAVLSRRQWALTCMIDGTLSVRDLAFAQGLPLYEVIEDVGDLVQAGLCAPVAVGAVGRTGPAAQTTGRHRAVPGSASTTTRSRVATAESAGRSTDVRATARRRQAADSPLPAAAAEGSQVGPSSPGAEEAELPPEADEADFTPVSIDALQRVLEGLRRLN